MPQSIDEFLNSSPSKKNKLQSIDEFLNPPEPSYPIGDLIAQGKLPPFSAADSELSRQAELFAQQPYQPQTQPESQSDLPGRDLPVIGPVLRSLDTVGKTIEPVVAPVRSLYTPGAGLANVAGFAGAAEAGIAKLLPKLGSTVGGRVAQTAAREAITGAPLGTGQYLAGGGNDTSDALESGLYGAALGGALGVAGKVIGAGAKVLGDKRAFRRSIDDFIAKTQQPRGPEDFVTHPNEALVQQAGGANPVNTGNQLAENFNRGESYQKEFEQAVQDQYDFLKQSMENRGGVDQGAILRDPTTGEVIDRIGRISDNPPWYQEFFAQHGRTPTNKDLRDLAEQQVKQGFQDSGGRIPSFKPEEIQKLDSEIADIQATIPHMEGEVKAGLQQELERLRGERERMAGVLPKGVQAMRVKGAPEPVMRSETTSPATASAPKIELPKVNVDTLPETPRRGTTNAVKPISRTEVIQNIKKLLGVVVDTGRLGIRSKSVLGIFKPHEEVIRSRAMHDVSTIAHEVGHALEKRFKVVDEQFQEEFMNILNKHSRIDMKAYKPHELNEEGFAEYMRLLLTEPQKAMEVAPKFTQHLFSKLPPKFKKSIEAVQKDIARWLQQDGLHSAMGKIDFVSGKTGKKFSFQRFYTKTFDDLNPLKLAMNAIYGKRSHLTRSAEENAYKLARLSRGTAERAQLAVSDGIYDENGMKLTDGLGEIVKDLEKIGVTEEEFATYLGVIHAQDLKALGKQITFTDDEIKSVLSELDSKAMRAVQQKVVKYNNALLDLLVESGRMSKSVVDGMKKQYPNYVPFMRLFDDDLEEGFQNSYGGGKGFANIGDPVKRMTEKGSERTLINPLESMVHNTFAVMNAAAKNRVGLSLLDLAQTEGAGDLLEIVPGATSAKEHVISVKLNGKDIHIKVRDPDLYDAILSLDKETSNTLIRFLGAATNALRGGATLTPEFMLRNAARDVMGAMVNVGFNPINFLKGFGYAISPGLRRMGFKNIENRVYEQFISSGGAMSTLWGSSRDYTRKAMKDAFKKSIRQKALNVVRNPLQLLKVWRPAVWLLKGLRTGAEISELSTKLGKFKSEMSRKKNPKSPLEAAFIARDLMDFNRAGSTIRSANQLIAFLNANLQGSDKMIREFIKSPPKFLLRGVLTLSLPTFALHVWYALMPEEHKKALLNVPNYQRDLFFLIPGPNNSFVRIPKPYEAGLIFSSSLDRGLRDWMQHEPAAYKGYFANLAATFTPPVMIQFFNPILESLANYSFFRATPIVPEGLQGEQRKFQYDVYTSETAKLAGEMMSHTLAKDTPFASPKIIDNLITDYFAGLGRYGTAVSDAAINLSKGGEDNPKPAHNPEQNPFVAPFMATARGSGELRNQFYDRYNQLTTARTSAKTHPEVKFNAAEYGRFHTAYNQMSKLNQQYKTILNDPKLTAVEKRDKLNVLDKQRNDLAYKTLYAK